MESNKQTNPPANAPVQQYPLRIAALAALVGVACIALMYFGEIAPYNALAILLYPFGAALMAAVLCGIPSETKSPIGGMLMLVPLLLPVVVACTLSEASITSTIAFGALMPATAVAIWLPQTRRKGGFLTAAAAAVVGIIVLYVIVCLPGILDGTGAFSLAQGVADELASLMRAQLEPFRLVAELKDTLALYDEALNVLVLSVPLNTTATLCSLGSLGGLLSLVCFYALTRRRREALGLPAPKPFRRWSIPKNYTLGIALLYGMALLMQLFEYTNADAVYNTVNALVGFPLTVQGLSLIAFLLARRKYPSKSLNAVLFVAIALLFPIAQSMLLMIGLFEQFLHVRERDLPTAFPPRQA